MRLIVAAALAACALVATPALSQKSPAAAPSVHMIWMGGNDCPPCKAWRMTELPKLERSAEFKAIKFSYVEKLIASTVPPSLFMPSEVKPYKEALDEASGGMIGSPQCAIVVDGKVYDYFHGTRKADDIEKMLVAIKARKGYPFKRCVRFDSKKKCLATS